MSSTLEDLLSLNHASLTLSERADAADRLVEFLNREIDRLPFEQNIDLQLAILSRLSLLGHPELKPMLVVFSQQHQNPEMKAKAQQLFDRVNCDIDRLLDETVVDQIADAASRARNLALLVDRDEKSSDVELVYASEDNSIRSLFASLKGLSIKVSNDEMLEQITLLLGSGSERFKLAVCLALVEMLMYESILPQIESHPAVFKEMADALALMAVGSDRPAHACYAVELLARLSRKDKQLDALVAHAKDQASRRFLDMKGKHYNI